MTKIHFEKNEKKLCTTIALNQVMFKGICLKVSELGELDVNVRYTQPDKVRATQIRNQHENCADHSARQSLYIILVNPCMLSVKF